MTEQELNLSPTRPYLARAIYEWICDNQLTPHYVPIEAVLGLYARENGQGLFFDPAEYPDTQTEKDTLKSAEQETTDSPKKKPSLRLLD
ncbi:hypothetical protein FOC39_10675 [Acinetobacter radioresistens]|uniref:ClpXP protease specificity-enhancing factor SspB n=1 Tax=Acinetobacter radioresistens TaxID=40216 RepID=UPI0015FEE8A2|nr:ClpXP protease specificity-enhancing factor SspB [Acinetobacter radioresistens]QMU04491.1 hypothetical protein FOC39_10675 [Acinetobacter radioresistens]